MSADLASTYMRAADAIAPQPQPPDEPEIFRVNR
jgi:hypothetical protein